MPTSVQIVEAEIHKRISGFRSAQTGAAANTDYTTSPLTTTILDNPLYPQAFIRAVMADVHSDLAWAIASVKDSQGIGNHPWRVHFADLTVNVTNGANLPTVGNTGAVIIGVLGRPYDAANVDQLMTPASAERVSAFNNAGIYTNPSNLYHINGAKVYHTTANIIFPVCAYDRDDLVAIISANGNYGTGAASGTIPDTLTMAWVAGCIAMAVVEEELMAQAGIYATYYGNVLERIASGRTDMPGLAMLGRAA